ncbi:MAG: ADP-heptose--lipooligosaccharide heptosyltransferase II [uncultured Rubrobacteraceae bacterium]|uniref:ADP-heptose--lipooligosaccharide heptosyltransferase II n=1 Tax=uncultured Rubrobacteraceae bacterium TaxID=349277 RepID=A0A6J4Q8F3_9ACTN|nr:MAG: ADP-heptose--lipooligosaccharide heptosyltransferase II [uncultured Rubrobacteraceae bacterium]
MSGSLAGQWAEARRVMVMRLDNIGDVVMTGPVLRALKENLPEASITLMASPGGKAAAPLLPWVDEVISWRVIWQDVGGKLSFDPARELEMIDTLKRCSYDAAIILTSFKQTPHPAGYACYLAGIPLRLGESKEFGGGVLTDEVPPAPDGLHQAERNLRAIEHAGFRVDDRSLSVSLSEAARAGAAGLLEERGIVPGSPYVLLNPWASASARVYPPDRFTLAARRISQETGWPVVVSGADADRGRSGRVLDALSARGVDLVGATTLPELAALVEGARLVLTNNTSTMHLLDALRVPGVVTYSGTELEEQWRPRHAPHRLLRRETWCSPCYAFECPYNLECLDIPSEEVAQAGLSLIAETGGETEPASLQREPGKS